MGLLTASQVQSRLARSKLRTSLDCLELHRVPENGSYTVTLEIITSCHVGSLVPL